MTRMMCLPSARGVLYSYSKVDH